MAGRPPAAGPLLACLFLFPIAFIVLVQTRTAVSTFYMSPATPALFIGAGVFLDRLVGLDSTLRPRWLLAALVAAMIFAAGAPTLISQYRDGRRWDFRGAAHWLDERLAPGDVVISDQPLVLAYYLPGRDVQRLIPIRLDSSRCRAHCNGQDAAGRSGSFRQLLRTRLEPTRS